MFVTDIIPAETEDFNGHSSRKSMKREYASGRKLCSFTNKTV